MASAIIEVFLPDLVHLGQRPDRTLILKRGRFASCRLGIVGVECGRRGGEEVLVMDVHYLSGRMVTHCGQCCATAEDGDFEFHNKKNRSKVERLTLDFVEGLSVDDHALGQSFSVHIDAVEVQTCFEV